jgi:uncharacterized protein YlzI (FlbEa/FlbD family)
LPGFSNTVFGGQSSGTTGTRLLSLIAFLFVGYLVSRKPFGTNVTEIIRANLTVFEKTCISTHRHKHFFISEKCQSVINEKKGKAMPRFIKLTQCDGETVIVNADRIDIIQDEDQHNRTKIIINGQNLYVDDHSDTIIRNSRFESGGIYLD